MKSTVIKKLQNNLKKKKNKLKKKFNKRHKIKRNGKMRQKQEKLDMEKRLVKDNTNSEKNCLMLKKQERNFLMLGVMLTLSKTGSTVFIEEAFSSQE